MIFLTYVIGTGRIYIYMVHSFMYIHSTIHWSKLESSLLQYSRNKFGNHPTSKLRNSISYRQNFIRKKEKRMVGLEEAYNFRFNSFLHT